ncbi:MAG: sulfur carrier protein ThiS [Nitrospiraceae bacterium]|nr:sulfur carrier protein ThiS [Nitrospiraceae bacterium]
MKITVNGRLRETAGNETITALLVASNLQPAATVVERNGVIVERTDYTTTTLEEGDVLELVRFVGGG